MCVSSFSQLRKSRARAVKLGVKRYLDNQYERDAFVAEQLAQLPQGARILDAGAGSQRYRESCSHLDYVAQDFGEYTVDEKASLTSSRSGEKQSYEYGVIDIRSDIWNIPEATQSFDAILCTEVIEHVPYPIETIQELSRLLRPGGLLILTAPSNCLRHFDPYFFTSGFSDRWYETILPSNGLEVEAIQPVGDYYRWMAVELARTVRNEGVISAGFLLPAFAYYSRKTPTRNSVNTLCMGYHVVARKRVNEHNAD
jgi:2-polyprenyl-3-methyl-5-hydroxy-6-metoxy-1,4-benzoquinol methylase